MEHAFTFQVSAHDVHLRAIREIGGELQRLGEVPFLDAMNDEELTDHLVRGWTLEPLEWDSQRPQELLEDDVVDGRGRRQSGTSARNAIYLLDLPLVPKPSNPRVLTLRPEKGWTQRIPLTGRATYLHDKEVLRLRGTQSDLNELRGTAQSIVNLINADIERYAPDLRPRVLGMVEGRRSELVKRASAFEQAAKELGVEVQRRPNATAPVNVRERREVRVLRATPRERIGPADPHLTRESTTMIVDLIDQAGKGFETARFEFRKLGEEGLRHVIVGYLNAVFHSTAVTGETFSKDGKPDLVIQAGGGPVLVGECKFWDGAELYARTIQQLFRYVTWRHTVAVLITFSERESLTRVISEAKRATREHPKIIGDVREQAETYFVSTHAHPDDSEKVVEIHHLLFNLYSTRDDEEG